MGATSSSTEPGDQAHGLKVAIHCEPGARAAVVAGGAVADQDGVAAVVDLGLLAWVGEDDAAGLGGGGGAEAADEALDALVAGGEAGLVDQVLPDGHCVAALGQGGGDDLAIGFAGAGGGGARFGGGRVGEWVGGLGWRFRRGLRCRLRRLGPRWSPVWPVLPTAGVPTPGRAQFPHRRPEVGRRGFAADPGRSLNLPQRPSQPSQRD